LASAWVRILADDYHLRLGVWRDVQRGEDLVVGWVYMLVARTFLDERLELGPVLLLKLQSQQVIPVCPAQRI